MKRVKEIAIQGLLSILIVAPCLALGAVHPAVLAIFLFLAAALFACLFASKRYGSAWLDLPGILLFAMIAFTLLQIIPLPAFLVKLISPLCYDVQSRALAPLGDQSVSFMPLSLDVPSTVIELGKLFFYTAVYFASLTWTRRQGSKFVLRLVIFAGVASSFVFLFHKITMLDAIYGFYLPGHIPFGSSITSAPLINENHLAGLLGICTAVAIGRGLTTRDRSNRILFIIMAGIIGGSLFLTLSRGGIAAFVCGQLLFVLIQILQRLKNKQSKHTVNLAWLPLGLACSLGIGLFTAQDAIWGEFVNGNTKKLDLIFESIPLAGRFFATGVGRGAFQVSLPLVSNIGSSTTFTHAENAVAQILADYGVIFGAIVLVVSLIAIGRLLKKPPSRIDHTAAVVAVIGFGLHNLVDFNMEVPGVAVLIAALLGMLMGTSDKKIKLPRPIFAAFSVCTIALFAILFFYLSDKTVDAEEKTMRRALSEYNAKLFSEANLEKVMNRHPSAWYFPFIAGVSKYETGLDNPLPWFARAIELNYASAVTHFYVGQTFLKVNKLDQALIELRLAAHFNPSLSHSVAKLMVSKIQSFDTLSSVAFARDDKLLLFGALADVFSSKGLDAEAEKADRAILKLNPSEPVSLTRHAVRLAQRGEMQEALKMSKILGRIEGQKPAAARISAAIHQEAGEHKRAVEILNQALAREPRNLELLTSLAFAKQRAGDLDGALETAEQISGLSNTIEGQADAAVLEADLMMASEKLQAALAHLSRAHKLNPSNTEILLKIVTLAERTNDQARLLEAFEELLKIDPNNKAIKARKAKIEDQAIQKEAEAQFSGGG